MHSPDLSPNCGLPSKTLWPGGKVLDQNSRTPRGKGSARPSFSKPILENHLHYAISQTIFGQFEVMHEQLRDNFSHRVQ